jgi:hypothetical protein
LWTNEKVEKFLSEAEDEGTRANTSIKILVWVNFFQLGPCRLIGRCVISAAPNNSVFKGMVTLDYAFDVSSDKFSRVTMTISLGTNRFQEERLDRSYCAIIDNRFS